MLHPSVTRQENTWVEDDSAFMGVDYVPANISKNLWYVGTQNGRSYYNFTSMESAVTNALFAVNEMESKNFPIEKPWELLKFIKIGLKLLLIVIVLILVISKFKTKV